MVLKAIVLVLLSIFKKILTWLESLGTDVNKKADIRIWLATIGILIDFKLALTVPTLIATGSTFDLIAYGTILTIVGSISLTLFGISKSSLDASNDTSGQDTSIVDDIKNVVTNVFKH